VLAIDRPTSRVGACVGYLDLSPRTEAKQASNGATCHCQRCKAGKWAHRRHSYAAACLVFVQGNVAVSPNCSLYKEMCTSITCVLPANLCTLRKTLNCGKITNLQRSVPTGQRNSSKENLHAKITPRFEAKFQAVSLSHRQLFKKIKIINFNKRYVTSKKI
jgi:hypothetical protein